MNHVFRVKIPADGSFTLRGGIRLKLQLKAIVQKRIEQYIGKSREEVEGKLLRKQNLFKQREAEIVHVKATGQVLSRHEKQSETELDYQLHLQYFIKQGDTFFIEEETEDRRVTFQDGRVVSDYENERIYGQNQEECEIDVVAERMDYTYDRLKAVKYAERWWNDFNPAYPKFTDDCSSFISQCLHAGGIPMWGSPNRNKGWWMSGKGWSFSWTVANALQQLLAGGKGIRTKQVRTAEQLNLGDIICIDFEGDGRFNHSLMVTAKDEYGMPLVNAHTTNSRHRYWTYEDSSAYTPNIVYKFYKILDGS